MAAGLGALLKIAIPTILFVVIWQYILPAIGLNPATSLLLSVAFVSLLVLLAGRLHPAARIPSNVPLIGMLARLNVTTLIIGLVVVSFVAGLIPNLFGTETPTATIPGTATPTVTTPTGCKDQIRSINPDLVGKASTVTFNAWDLESNTPYSSTVNFGTDCWIYKNGNAGTNYVNTTSTTQGSSMTGTFAVGDTVYVYCGGTTYYGDPVEGLCVDSEAFTVNLDAHTIVGTSNLAITGYDDTGATALTAAPTNMDYNLTLSANEEKSIYLKLKANAANKGFYFGGWGIAKFYNISDIDVIGQDGRIYTAIPTPVGFQSQSVQVNGTTHTISKDYVIHKLSPPIMMHEWESIKDQFVVKAHATNDPLVQGNCNESSGWVCVNASNYNGCGILAFDAAWAKGSDGKAYLDVYAHTDAEANVGMTETLTSPAGKDNGVLILAV